MILISSSENISIKDLQKYFRKKGISELWIPKEIIYMKNPPLLGSGKFNYVEVTNLYLRGQLN